MLYIYNWVSCFFFIFLSSQFSRTKYSCLAINCVFNVRLAKKEERNKRKKANKPIKAPNILRTSSSNHKSLHHIPLQTKTLCTWDGLDVVNVEHLCAHVLLVFVSMNRGYTVSVGSFTKRNTHIFYKKNGKREGKCNKRRERKN